MINTAAEYGGSLSILQEFYKEVKSQNSQNSWFFCISNLKHLIVNDDNILDFSWTKKSWLHRIYFDNFVVKKLVKRLKIDLIFSMQNVTFPGVKVKQIVYLHNSIQFSPYKYSFFKPGELNFWFRQNIIAFYMRKTLRKADAIILQSNWLQAKVEDWLSPSKIKICIVKPFIHDFEMRDYNLESAINTFFYPADGGHHKNHDIIINACLKLKELNIHDYRVIFTLHGYENYNVKKIYERVNKNKLPISFIGNVSKKEVFRHYSISTLLFPSVIETFGLPLLEAKLAKSIIFASDLPFSHEILDLYENSSFFNPNNFHSLAELMMDNINGKFLYKKNVSVNNEVNNLLYRVILNLALGDKYE